MTMNGSIRLLGCTLVVLAGVVAAPRARAAPLVTDAWLDETAGRWQEVARRVWGFHELAWEERQSSALLADVLEREGFAVERGVAGIPTAFVARAGQGAPVIGLLAEYDALPGLSQEAGATAEKRLEAGAPGHGCGHNLLGTAAVAAGIAANRARVADHLPGTIVLFGTPAEEQLTGKGFLARAGVFDHVDAVLAWHPGTHNELVNRVRLALSAMDVEFFGKTAHAAANPWFGRGALDAVELLDHAMALMREHVRPSARMHRVIKAGGTVPNVISDYAKVQWWVRAANVTELEELVGRVRKAADGVAAATETRARVTLLAQTRDVVPNDTLGGVLQRELERVGPPRWDAADQEQARALQERLGVATSGLSDAVVPYGPAHGAGASSDIGETSAVAPLAELEVVTRPLGTPSHHWVVTSCSAHPIGFKGMGVAAKVLAASAVDLLRDPALVRAARAEFVKATGGKPYRSPLAPDARPVSY